MKPLWYAILATVIFLARPCVAQQQVPSDAAFVQTAKLPADYILEKVKDHRVVLLGEAHWIRHDPVLVASLVPRLPDAGATALAVEMFRTTDQTLLDRVVTAPEWDESAAMAVMRTAEWPYREYLDIIRAVWQTNHSGKKLRLLALGPGSNWRETLLPKGENYDTFMAGIVTQQLASDPKAHILMYAGLNHVFTRYYQPELPRATRVEAFMDRAGNILWRKFGQEVFTVVLHHPWRCYQNGKLARCLPADGQIDCAAANLAHGIGFDIAKSPFAHSSLTGFEYALGYPDLRFGDVADGYVWREPLSDYKSVTLIPVADFAPDQPSLDFVSAHSPFSDEKSSTRPELEKQWAEQAEWLRDTQQTRGWASVSTGCFGQR